MKFKVGDRVIVSDLRDGEALVAIITEAYLDINSNPRYCYQADDSSSGYGFYETDFTLINPMNDLQWVDYTYIKGTKYMWGEWIRKI